MLRARQGDPAAFELLVADLLPRWVGEARRLVGPGPDAEDVVFRVVEKLWSALRNSGLAIESLEAYGRRAVINQATDLLRARRPSTVEVDRGLGSPDPLEVVLAREGRAQLDQALAALDAEDRRIVELRAFDQLSFEQIARQFADASGAPRTDEWARKRHQRACRKLHDVARRLLGGET